LIKTNYNHAGVIELTKCNSTFYFILLLDYLNHFCITPSNRCVISKYVMQSLSLSLYFEMSVNKFRGLIGAKRSTSNRHISASP